MITQLFYISNNISSVQLKRRVNSQFELIISLVSDEDNVLPR